MMEEIKKTTDSKLEKVAGGSKVNGKCCRCGGFDTWGKDWFGTKTEACTQQLYGKNYCKKCFEILDNLEKQGHYIGNEELLKKIEALEKEITKLREK